MPCAGAKLTVDQAKVREQKLRDLEAQIASGKVTVKVNGRKVEFVGWETDRTGPGHWHDDCAYRTLSSSGSSALRQALARQQPRQATRSVTT
jgi:hypothetical protein